MYVGGGGEKGQRHATLQFLKIDMQHGDSPSRAPTLVLPGAYIYRDVHTLVGCRMTNCILRNSPSYVRYAIHAGSLKNRFNHKLNWFATDFHHELNVFATAIKLSCNKVDSLFFATIMGIIDAAFKKVLLLG